MASFPAPDAPAEPARPVVLFDARCRLCSASVARLRALDREARIEWLSLHEPAVVARFPQADGDAIRRELHVVCPDGAMKSGIDAVEVVARALGGPGGRAVTEALALPGGHAAGQLLYLLVSAGRGASTARA